MLKSRPKNNSYGGNENIESKEQAIYLQWGEI